MSDCERAVLQCRCCSSQSEHTLYPYVFQNGWIFRFYENLKKTTEARTFHLVKGVVQIACGVKGARDRAKRHVYAAVRLEDQLSKQVERKKMLFMF